MLYLAIDGGGTKTEGILADENRTVLAHRKVGPSNPLDLSLPTAVDVLTSLVRDLLRDASVTVEKGKHVSVSLFAGIAGVLSCRDALQAALTRSLQALLTERDAWNTLRFERIGIDSDIAILFAAEIPDEDGVCVISGTGSVCFLYQKGAMTRIGGWGYLLDSGGNGYSIGRDALEAVLRAHDGRASETLLTELLREHIGDAVPDALHQIYTGGKAFIASLAPVVFAAAEAGDSTARHILRRNAEACTELIAAACRQSDISDGTLPVILGGGLMQNRPDWVKLVCECLPNDSPARLIVASKPPVMGALTLAHRQIHHPHF